MPKPNHQPTVIAIDTKTIIKGIAILAGIYLLINIWGIILIMLAAFVFSWAIDPLVDKLAAKKIPRTLSLVGIYIIIVTALVASVSLLVPPLVQETADLANNLPLLAKRLEPFVRQLTSFSRSHPWLNLDTAAGSASQALQSGLNNLLSGLGSFFSGLLSLFLILVITFYMVAEEQAMKKLISSLTPAKQRARVLAISEQVQRKMGHWLIGQLFLCFVIFLFTYVSLSILGVKYALLLAIIAGVTEAIPYLGPILASVPGIFIAFSQAPLLAVFVGLTYFLIQQIENSILVPTVMRQAVGLNPIISIMVLLLGYELGGVLGAVLAIPLSTAAEVILRERNKAAKPRRA